MGRKDPSEFYTVRGYALRDQAQNQLTHSMEDYLEMIYRLTTQGSAPHIQDLAQALNVKPPSATRMVQRLALAGLVEYRPYRPIALTEQGSKIGSELLRRHNTISSFLKLLGVTENLQEDTERLEHNLSSQTVAAIRQLVEFFCQSNSAAQSLAAFLARKPTPESDP